MLAAIEAKELRPALFFYGEFKTGPVRVWTGIGTVNWGGHDWTGLGSLAGIGPIEEGTNVEARGITITLSGFDSTLLTDVLYEFQLGATAIVYFGCFSPSMVLVDTPYSMWSGRMDQPTISTDGSTATISINCESRLVDLNVAVDRRYTDADQQLDYPGDTGLSRVMAIQNVTIYWGQTANKTNMP